MITVVVQFKGKPWNFSLAEGAGVADLQKAVEDSVGVQAQYQKLIYKGKILRPSTKLHDAGVANGSKIMLMAGQAPPTSQVRLHYRAIHNTTSAECL